MFSSKLPFSRLQSRQRLTNFSMFKFVWIELFWLLDEHLKFDRLQLMRYAIYFFIQFYPGSNFQKSSSVNFSRSPLTRFLSASSKMGLSGKMFVSVCSMNQFRTSVTKTNCSATGHAVVYLPSTQCQGNFHVHLASRWATKLLLFDFSTLHKVSRWVVHLLSSGNRYFVFVFFFHAKRGLCK